jgi:hypothetical protein
MHGRHLKALAGILLAIVITAVTVSDSHAQTTLRYRFAVGDTMNYDIDQTTRTTMFSSGNELFAITATTHLEMTWQVKTLFPNGNARIVATINRIHYRLESPPAPSLECDTKEEKAPSDARMATIVAILKAAVGPNLELTMDGAGNMSDVRISEKVGEALDKLADKSGKLFSGDGLKGMLSSAWLLLPPKAVSKGSNWQQSFDVKLPFATLKVSNACSLDDSIKVGGRSLDRIVIKPKISFEPGDNPDYKLELKDQSGEASATFDAAAGRLVETQRKQMTFVEMSIRNASIDEKLEQTTTLKLRDTPKP